MAKKIALPGFSLIEVSISLLILGIISSVVMTQLNIFNKVHTNQKTHNNIDFVVKAIAAYCMSNDDRLPFPSTSGDVGIQNESMKDTFGCIPFKTLGIMEKFSKNGNGKKLLYRMNPHFGQSSTTANVTLGISEFHSDIKDDKVAIIIKSQDANGRDEIVVWYSEKSFIANFMNGTMRRTEARTGLFDEEPI
ncbi:MAG: prepilin-type N-terminal cleavage/methylation domain-containing protein [Holosporales bacterium]|jgi:prepilin-type N-terminal cleavage/methylation domain-containing protein|nr:prepilin-type N-terminal cleavage/methylation domain-containing protein [Holosporales bacterium]